jgi:hypothetical protein
VVFCFLCCWLLLLLLLSLLLLLKWSELRPPYLHSSVETWHTVAIHALVAV